MKETPTECVCRHYGLDPQRLKITTKAREITEPRQVLMVILNFGFNMSLNHSRENLPLSHSSVAHARRTVLNLYDTDKVFRARVDAILVDLELSAEQKNVLFQRLRKQIVKPFAPTGELIPG